MKITEIRPMLWTEDLYGTIDFYTSVLGFTACEVNDDWGWATLRVDNVAIMLSRPNDHTRYDKIGFTGSFYFNTDAVDSMWDKLRDKTKVCYGIEDFDYGMREFAVFDNNGYLLQFGQEIESAVCP
ncbi:MAG: VOC family protein [Pyrinomonadaceae bacterium]